MMRDDQKLQESIRHHKKALQTTRNNATLQDVGRDTKTIGEIISYNKRQQEIIMNHAKS